MEQVEEGGEVHGGRGPSHRGSRGIGGRWVRGGVGDSEAAARSGERSGKDGLVAGRTLGLHAVPGGAVPGGPADLNETLDAEASLGIAECR
jgi:hypothetical protein